MTRWTMIADLERCVGCQTCTAACRHANATSPAVQWRRVLDIESGSYPDVARTFVPVGCQHCEDPPCMHVCPTTATRKRADGIVTVDYDICIGCAYCDVACPYQARFKVSRKDFAYGTPMRNESEDARRIGVSQKCTFCSDRIDAGLARGLVPGRDADATPACVNSCIADALHFGDAQDPTSNVSKLLAENSSFRMHEELRTAPNFHYLHDRRHTAAKPTSGPISGPDIEPRHQEHWDWKAAMNFVCGGAGASLLALSVLYGRTTTAFFALALIAVGLGILFFKIGRPGRFLYVLRQPRRSWMSREAWLAGFLFPSAAFWIASGKMGAVVVLIALGFLLAQAMILKEARGIPAWRTPRVVSLIVLTGLAEGAALFCFVAPLAMVLALLVACRWFAWWRYRDALANAPARTVAVLDAFQPWMFWGGLVAPLLLIILKLPLLAAIAVVASGWALKMILVTRAGWQQGFALERAGTVLKPGWTNGGKA